LACGAKTSGREPFLSSPFGGILFAIAFPRDRIVRARMNLCREFEKQARNERSDEFPDKFFFKKSAKILKL
jgi:hypothetical protein